MFDDKNEDSIVLSVLDTACLPYACPRRDVGSITLAIYYALPTRLRNFENFKAIRDLVQKGFKGFKKVDSFNDFDIVQRFEEVAKTFFDKFDDIGTEEGEHFVTPSPWFKSDASS